MINGIININKEKGYTSHDVVAKLRGIMKQKKIGHTGTLDPLATGVLPVCLGNATKLCDLLVEKEKEYIAKVRLGVRTDTQDMTGRILETAKVKITKEELSAVMQQFLGTYDQIPPMYSAIKIQGKKLYELAREGKEIERKARQVTISEISLLETDLPCFIMKVRCSKGTYIRTLCEDIGVRLGCFAAMEELQRIKSGQFDLSTALTLEEVEEKMRICKETGKEVSEFILSVDRFFSDCKALKVGKSVEKLVINGNPMEDKWVVNGNFERSDKEKYRIYIDDDEFIGIYEYRKSEGKFYPYKMFLDR